MIYDKLAFRPWPKIPRLSRDVIISEKLDGTNASVYIGDAGEFLVGSRTRWITPENDNYGFAAFAYANKEELLKLGPGHHFGEYWGSHIQRGYGLPKNERRFSLFNTSRWRPNPHGSGVNDIDGFQCACVSVVPILFRGPFCTDKINSTLYGLAARGSVAAPGFLDPEGVIIYHVAGGAFFKKTIKDDAAPKLAIRAEPTPSPAERPAASDREAALAALALQLFVDRADRGDKLADYEEQR